MGGKDYPYSSNPQCNCCASQYREVLERQTVEGQPWGQIVDSLPSDANLTERNIRDHYTSGHFPLSDPAVQEVMVEAARRRGDRATDMARGGVSFLQFCRGVVATVDARMFAGDVQPTIRDAISAAGLLARFDPLAPGMTEADYIDAYSVYIETAEAMFAPADFRALMQALADNPVLRALTQRWDEARGRSDANTARIGEA